MVLSFATISTSSPTKQTECQVCFQPAVSPLGSMMLAPPLAEAPPEALPAKWLLLEGDKTNHLSVISMTVQTCSRPCVSERASLSIVQSTNTCRDVILPSLAD